MNISDLISDIKMATGLETIALPFDKPVEVIIAEILHMTVRTFSQDKPLIKEFYEGIENLESMNEFDKKLNIYVLPSFLTTTTVLTASATTADIRSVNEVSNANAFSVGSPFVGFGSYYRHDVMNAIMTSAAVNKFMGVTTQPPTSKWLGHNKIRLINFPTNGCVHFTAKCCHDLSAETIPETCWDFFMQLAIVDVKMSLYNRLKNMRNVGGAIKDIQINIDDWSGAEAERKELIQYMTDNSYLDDTDLWDFF